METRPKIKMVAKPRMDTPNGVNITNGKCKGITKKGRPCKNMAKFGNYCYIHKDTLNINRSIGCEMVATKNSHFNHGEKGEIITVQKLFEISVSENYKLLENIFGKEADQGIEILDLETLRKVESVNEIKKSRSLNKCDCIIKLVKTGKIFYISIKCKNCAPPAILNHTPRSANCFRQSGDLYEYLTTLDQIVMKMNNMRYNGGVGEDIPVTKINLTEEENICLKNVIRYFIFFGTGSRKAKYVCNSVLEVIDSQDPVNWNFFQCDSTAEKNKYIGLIYNQLILSMRDKGMPRNHCQVCEPWIFYQDENGKEKGSLHIRMRK